MTPKFLLIAAVACAAFAQQATTPLPTPFATPSAKNGPQVIKHPDGVELRLPQGFHIEEFAADFKKPRGLAVAPNNVVLVSDSVVNGTVYAVINGSRKVLAGSLDRPYGLAFWKRYLYIAEATSVKRYKYNAKSLTLGPGQEVVNMKDFGQGHWTRALLFDGKGKHLYVGIGSASDAGPVASEMRAAINRYNPDGTGQQIFAAGLRNPVGIAWAPGTSTLWATVQERDGMGDELVPDYFTHVEPDGFYGWPYAYAGPNEDPRYKGQQTELVKKTKTPDILLRSHIAVMDVKFYTGKQFPEEYQGGAFLATHGSSNRAQRVGYSVLFVPFSGGKPSGPPREFLTGWMMAADKREVWGRPVGLLQLPDGSLLLSDDGGNKVWRISYGK
ncbi:MAG: PQQ-dependent sugar dehydrogenase [Bryobacteraceae bacterium]